MKCNEHFFEWEWSVRTLRPTSCEDPPAYFLWGGSTIISPITCSSVVILHAFNSHAFKHNPKRPASLLDMFTSYKKWIYVNLHDVWTHKPLYFLYHYILIWWVCRQMLTSWPGHRKPLVKVTLYIDEINKNCVIVKLGVSLVFQWKHIKWLVHSEIGKSVL